VETNQREWSTVLRQAVIRLKPDYFALPGIDRDDHRFQEQARKQEDPDYTPRTYRGNVHRCWARLVIDGGFHYADISSLAGYLTDMLGGTGFERIDELIRSPFARVIIIY